MTNLGDILHCIDKWRQGDEELYRRGELQKIKTEEEKLEDIQKHYIKKQKSKKTNYLELKDIRLHEKRQKDRINEIRQEYFDNVKKYENTSREEYKKIEEFLFSNIENIQTKNWNG